MTVPSEPLILRRVRSASTTAISGLMKRIRQLENAPCVLPLTACASDPKSFTITACPCRKSPTGVTKVPLSVNSDASVFGVLLNESVDKVVSERTNGCFVLSWAGARRTGHTDDEHKREKG